MLANSDTRRALRELAGVFLKLGTIGFGGPAAHVALMQEEIVRRRRWLTQEEFLDLLGATNLIPGPNSTEMAIHVGHRRAGWPGLLVAGVCFILPAMLIVLGCAWAYVRYGALPQAMGILYGIKPVVIVIVAQALWGLARTALKSASLGAISVAVVAGNVAGANELLLLLAAGLAAFVVRTPNAGRGTLAGFALPFPFWRPMLAATVPAAAAAGATPFGLGPLFLFFLKVGSVLYGSGYVLLAFLRGGLVERMGWLTEAQLLDAVAVGQFTPGPLFTAATFVGYLLGGTSGALVATLGIFLPAFVFVALSGPLVPRLRGWPAAGAFLDGVNAASLALMAVVTWQLSRAAVLDGLTVALAFVSAVLLLRFKLNSAWLVGGGAVVGLVKALA